MVTRPIFIPEQSHVGVKIIQSPPFTWHPGFSMVQKRKNVTALHTAIRQMGEQFCPLEVSSRSDVQLGIDLSAFNLGVKSKGRFFSVESVYQASKVFASGAGPFPELYAANPAEVRNAVKKHETSPLTMYEYGNEIWSLTPTRAFYDWIYCRALNRNSELVNKLTDYTCFTDIAFNPVKAVNCQAYAVALYISIANNGLIEEALSEKELFLKYHPNDIVELAKTNNSRQGTERNKKRNMQDQLLL